MAKSIKLRNPITKEPFYPITLIKNVYSNDGTQTLLNGLYPVGSIYISTNSKSPADIFGGAWERIQDRFLLGAGSSYSAGATGGEASHRLTVEEIPTHRHQETFQDSPVISTWTNYSDGGQSGGWKLKGDVYGTAYKQFTMYAGGGEYHNNMPPYLVVYMWKRIS